MKDRTVSVLGYIIAKARDEITQILAYESLGDGDHVHDLDDDYQISEIRVIIKPNNHEYDLEVNIITDGKENKYYNTELDSYTIHKENE